MQHQEHMHLAVVVPRWHMQTGQLPAAWNEPLGPAAGPAAACKRRSPDAGGGRIVLLMQRHTHLHFQALQRLGVGVPAAHTARACHSETHGLTSWRPACLLRASWHDASIRARSAHSRRRHLLPILSCVVSHGSPPGSCHDCLRRHLTQLHRPAGAHRLPLLQSRLALRGRSGATGVTGLTATRHV